MDDTNPKGCETTGSPADTEPLRRLCLNQTRRHNVEEYA